MDWSQPHTRALALAPRVRVCVPRNLVVRSAHVACTRLPSSVSASDLAGCASTTTGQAGGAPGPVVDPLVDLGNQGSLRLTRPLLFDYVNGAGPGDRFTLRARAEAVWDLVRTGVFPFGTAAMRTKVLPFGEKGATEAHRLLESRDAMRGKVLLRL